MTRPPVLLIVFNRPGPTRRVLAAIRAQRPSRLYIAADGPRPGREDDERNCAEVRRIAEEVDWPCDVSTLFQEANLGCGPGPRTAIDWFFAHEDAGAILEDDCLPHRDFLSYCQWALDKYRGDRRVWHVGGNNFCAPARLFGGASVGFISLAQVWGWATWRDRWAHYEYDAGELLKTTGDGWRGWGLTANAAKRKLADLRRTAELRHTWDFQWQVTVLNNRGMALVPSGNLISNIGDGDDATHTPGDDRCGLPVMDSDFDSEAWDQTAPQPDAVNRAVQGHFLQQMHLTGGLATTVLRRARRLRRLVSFG